VLRAHAAGGYGDEAAAELLIGHRSWLRRDDFVERFVLRFGTDPAMACVDGPAAVAALQAGRLPCCSGESAVLRIAASLAAGAPVDLGAAVCGLDERNLGFVVSAVGHAGGRRPAGCALGQA
jgi:hypothetical protein